MPRLCLFFFCFHRFRFPLSPLQVTSREKLLELEPSGAGIKKRPEITAFLYSLPDIIDAKVLYS
jgi:hypothetical protein